MWWLTGLTVLTAATARGQEDPGEPLDLPSQQLAAGEQGLEGEIPTDEDEAFFEENYDIFVPGSMGVQIDMPEVTDIEWQWPLYGRVSSHYGWRMHPRLGGRYFHHGIDIAAAPGRRVKAAGPGVVHYAGRGGGYGNLVEVRHPDGHITRYAHMTQLLVKTGDTVLGGDPVGTVGNTGRSTGPHLHFEFRTGRKTENPAVVAIVFGEPVDARAKQKNAILRAPAVPGSPLEEGLRDGLSLVRRLLTLALAPFV